MIELAKHIEVLLLENDCVIVPGLGGFIAHYCSSKYNKETREFCPPVRSIGFNPKLVMNDGLLVQSYMQAYNTDFPDATRKIKTVVEELKGKLYQDGQVCLNQVGTLYYNINGVYEFEPAENGFFTPSLYGLVAFTPQQLPFRPAMTTEPLRRQKPVMQLPRHKQIYSYRRWMKNAVAVAATILLFFLFSVPVKNTYIDETSYASLGSAGLFDAIRNQSAASSVLSPISQVAQEKEKPQEQKKQVKNNVNTLKPVAVKTEKVETLPETKQIARATKKETKVSVASQKKETVKTVPASKKNGKVSHIIVASLTNATDAESVVESLKKKGYTEAQTVISQGRYRVSLYQYADKADAYKKVQELKSLKDFASAWVFTSK